jgi:NAD-dependent deacetylase
MKKIVVLSGAGVSAESGIPTFRDANGLWEGHDIMDVASPYGWRKNPALVLEFYNQRRKFAYSAKPNAGHFAIAQLEDHFQVVVVTQNVDNLHEKAGSSNVIHLHGELFKVRSTLDESIVLDLEGWELNVGDKCPRGSQLRPHIVWFGESVPNIEKAIQETKDADIFIVVGTSLVVYPAASLIEYVDHSSPKYIVDKRIPEIKNMKNLYKIEKPSSEGLPELVNELLVKYAV